MEKPSYSSFSKNEMPSKKAYYLADVMQFAVPFIKTAIPPSPGNLPEMPEQQTTQVLSPSTSDYDESIAENDTEPASFSQQPSSPFSPPPPPLQQTAQTKRNTEGKSCQKQKFKVASRRKCEEDADVSIAEYFTAKKTKLDQNQQDERKESIKMFLLSLIPDLCQLSDVQIREFKRRVLNIIDDIELSAVSPTENTTARCQSGSVTYSNSSSLSAVSVPSTPHNIPPTSQYYENFRHSLSPTEVNTYTIIDDSTT
ncbi:unnamed protein product [Acanthoscelides obtectus]|uniref:BESS domain-containing protein n=1 Tax=Acanthoscelides obtectus TaxID=200917 RepID=A0A9P0PXY0_ACAOB|nr:unnamed protein product [Acanthoscelides obtectus]CAK1680555.1 hypothetical protein AOBTE_LOCUS32755 [Acanthoscelides obtectus]